MKITLPLLAPGQWFVEHERPGLISVSTDKSSMCSMDYDERDKEWCELHAKAFSAVPDLLQTLADAFTRACETVDSIEAIRGPDSPEVEPAYEEVCAIRDQYRAALEKAGCTIL